MQLYELSEEFAAVAELLAANEEIDQQTIDDTLEGVRLDLDVKVENTVKLIRNMQADADGLKAESERLSRRKLTTENKIKGLKEYLKMCYERAGITEAGTGVAGARLQRNAPSVEIEDEQRIPSDYLIEQQPKLDKKAILSALKEGADVPGARLIQKRSIRLI